jgi:hypothetical protein
MIWVSAPIADLQHWHPPSVGRLLIKAALANRLSRQLARLGMHQEWLINCPQVKLDGLEQLFG